MLNIRYRIQKENNAVNIGLNFPQNLPLLLFKFLTYFSIRHSLLDIEYSATCETATVLKVRDEALVEDFTVVYRFAGGKFTQGAETDFLSLFTTNQGFRRSSLLYFSGSSEPSFNTVPSACSTTCKPRTGTQKKPPACRSLDRGCGS